MVKPSRARMRSAVLLGSLLALLPALPALAADPMPAAEAPGPQLRAGSLMLIPAPSNVQPGQGSGITVRADTVLQAEGEAAQRVASQFADLLARSGGPRLGLAKGKAAARTGGIRFQIVPTFRDSGEGYTLESTAQGVVVQAGNETGLFYGATTLAQLATGGSNGVLPAVQIQDAPRFSWRGFMLDSARHFQSLDEIKRVLDAMAAHLHLAIFAA